MQIDSPPIKARHKISMFRMNKKCLFCLSLENKNDNNEFNIELNCLASKKYAETDTKLLKRNNTPMPCIVSCMSFFLIPLSHSECT